MPRTPRTRSATWRRRGLDRWLLETPGDAQETPGDTWKTPGRHGCPQDAQHAQKTPNNHWHPETPAGCPDTSYFFADKEAMDKLKLALTKALAIKAVDYASSGRIVLSVYSSLLGWGAILHQEDYMKKRYPARYESGIWTDAEKKYDAGNLECRRLLKKFRYYLYGVRFLVEIDASMLVH